MADYTVSKPLPGAIAPQGAIATPWGRLEPLLTPEKLKIRHLLGIPLVTRLIDPQTKRAQTITDEMLKEFIQLAVNEAELDTDLTIMPTQYAEKLPYCRQDYDQYGYFKLTKHPVASLESLTIQLADGGDIFSFPLEWIEVGNMVYGQVNLVPIAYQTLTSGGYAGASTIGVGGNSVFFNNLWNRDWVPALMYFKYTSGFPNGMVPTYVNELIGIVAAMRVLSQLGAMNARVTSQSLGVDGLSQSVSGSGPQIYVQRLQELDTQRKFIVKKLRASYQSNFVITAI